jgi:hypothetical protein
MTDKPLQILCALVRSRARNAVNGQWVETTEWPFDGHSLKYGRQNLARIYEGRYPTIRLRN